MYGGNRRGGGGGSRGGGRDRDRDFGGGGGGGYGGGGFGGPSTAPVKVGDELEVTIEAVGEKGDGIAKKDGFVLFIPGVKAGDRVRVRVTKVLRKVGFAEVTGKGEAPAEAESSGEESSEEAPAEEAESEPEPSSEDSESFGEDDGGEEKSA